VFAATETVNVNGEFLQTKTSGPKFLLIELVIE
jgi:hypothetical protein